MGFWEVQLLNSDKSAAILNLDLKTETWDFTAVDFIAINSGSSSPGSMPPKSELMRYFTLTTGRGLLLSLEKLLLQEVSRDPAHQPFLIKPLLNRLC